MKKHYIVSTHLGDESTWAVSEKKAISNVRYRIFGSQPADWHCQYWTAREVA